MKNSSRIFLFSILSSHIFFSCIKLLSKQRGNSTKQEGQYTVSCCQTMSGAGVATGAGTKVDVTLKLPQLQNLCKRDPAGYKEDYDAQVRRLESECGILKLSPQSPSPRLVELIQFAAAVSSSSYKGEESDRIAAMLIELLVGSPAADDTNKNSSKAQKLGAQMTMPTAALQLHREVRKTCVSALILMRNKGTIEPLRLLELFFRLMAVVPDKGLRDMLYRHMVNDIRNINKKGKREDAVNRSVQSFLHRVVATHGQDGEGEETATDIAAKRATDMVCELYRRQVWTDDRTVAILASAIVSKNNTVMSRAIKFFLNIEDKMALDKKISEDNEWDASQKVDLHRFAKKKKSLEREVNRNIKNRLKQQMKREKSDDWIDLRDDKGVEAAKKLYPAIELLRDPQGLAEAVLKKLKTPKSIPYNVKLLMMNFVTRLVGNHELLLLNLYPFLQKYMGGHQRDVTAVLAYTVQACHEHVPPDEIYGILKTISHNFITERCSEEQMAVGINAVRAICSRVPCALSMEEGMESTGSAAMDVEAFTRDMAAYSNHQDRSVSIAGKAWTNFIRETYPSLLQGKDRGLKGSALHRAKVKPMRYGERKVSTGVAGADLLVEYESKKAAYLLAKELAGAASKNDDEDEEEGDDDEEDFEEVDDEEEEDMESDDEESPELVVLEGGKVAADGDTKDDEDGTLDVSKMSVEERNKLIQEVSSTRVFTTAEFTKMRKLVEREERAKRDPREAARRKRAIARGEEFDELSGDSEYDSDDSDDDDIRVAGAVNPNDIMALAKKKRLNKAEKLKKIIAGRDKFENKQRAGGSTNIEKLRKKNFLMSKDSRAARSKGRDKAHNLKDVKKRQGGKQQMGHEAKKRRRKT
jgi:protein SDA1